MRIMMLYRVTVFIQYHDKDRNTCNEIHSLSVPKKQYTKNIEKIYKISNNHNLKNNKDKNKF